MRQLVLQHVQRLCFVGWSTHGFSCGCSTCSSTMGLLYFRDIPFRLASWEAAGGVSCSIVCMPALPWAVDPWVVVCLQQVLFSLVGVTRKQRDHTCWLGEMHVQKALLSCQITISDPNDPGHMPLRETVKMHEISVWFSHANNTLMTTQEPPAKCRVHRLPFFPRTQLNEPLWC